MLSKFFSLQKMISLKSKKNEFGYVTDVRPRGIVSLDHIKNLEGTAQACQ